MFMWWLFTMLFASFRFASLVSFGFVPELWGFIRLRSFVFFMDSFFFLAGSQARWPYPRNHFYLCLLVVRSIAMLRYLPLVISCLPCCHVKPLTHLPSKPLFGYVTALLSPSYSVVSCRVKLKFVPCWNMFMLGYHNISYLINASIYLVKGGRLGLMPGVLFHSCCPSFRHTGVMILDFAFLMRLDVMGTPWQFALNKNPLARPNLGFTFAT